MRLRLPAMARDHDLTAPSAQDNSPHQDGTSHPPRQGDLPRPPRSPHQDDLHQDDLHHSPYQGNLSHLPHQDDTPQEDDDPHQDAFLESDLAVATIGHDYVGFYNLDRKCNEHFGSTTTEFQRVQRYQKQIRENAEAAKAFKLKRWHENKNPAVGIQSLFHIMRTVARYIHTDSIDKARPSPLQLSPGKSHVLDIGMAPGGFLDFILEINRDVPDLSAKSITLPHDLGGHEILLQSYRSGAPEAEVPTVGYGYEVALGQDQSVDIHHFDITMFAGDLGMKTFPSSHPDRVERDTFLPPQRFLKERFNLVICGCQLVRSRTDGLKRIDGPERIEKVRNFTAQLAIGLDRLAADGTMIVLMHELEAWHNVHMIWQFRQFSDHVDVVKPNTVNTRNCTAYMIAQGVRANQREATQAVERWRDEWKTAMFQTEEEYVHKYVTEDKALVERVLSEIEPHLSTWGQRIWRIQADALEADLSRFQ